ncbi:MAG TPA: hypothetical protein VK184_02140 [Nostocaceae cyanobacterium]|nr:hypothetical protein [Nostocaceae cyanobacterium]
MKIFCQGEISLFGSVGNAIAQSPPTSDGETPTVGDRVWRCGGSAIFPHYQSYKRNTKINKVN